jgi:hypothetical protein
MTYFFSSRNAVLWLIILVFSLNSSQAQNPSTKTDNSKDTTQKEVSSLAQEGEYSTSRNEIGFYGGVSTFHKDLRGPSAGGNFGMFAFRYSHVAKESRSLKLRYVADLIPVAILNYPRNREFQNSNGTTQIVRDRKTVYGYGIVPGGLQLNFRRGKKYQPFAAGSLGIMYFTSVVPDLRTPLNPRATGAKLNFTAEMGGGVEIGLRNNRNLIIGYKYHHLSNLYTGNMNVGFNSNMVYTGMNFGF